MTATQPTSYDRAAITRRAWALWNLARDVAGRPAFNGTAIEAAARRAGKSALAAIETRNAEWHERRSVSGIHSFGDAMRAAWSIARDRVTAARAEAARIAAYKPREMTEFEARRFFAEMSDDASVTARELRQIAADEARSAA